MDDKDSIRQRLRQARRDHVASLAPHIRALIFRHPPGPVVDLVPRGAVIGLYRATPFEAPAENYAKFFFEAGHRIALPRFATRNGAMEFRAFSDPFGETDLETGPFGLLQPRQDAAEEMPDVLFVPVVGFTGDGHRLGQGGGHYDRWLAANPGAIAIGLAWDCQLVAALPCEQHDHRLHAVVTPTRLYGPF